MRELENAVQRALVLGQEEQILPEDLPPAVRKTLHGASLSAGTYHEVLDASKRQLILDAFRQSNARYKDAAELLGLTPNYLHRLIRNLDMKAALKKVEAELKK